MDIKDVAKEIRVILKKEFPATKFSVTISRFSMGSSADVSWTDGPTTAQVDVLIGHYGNSRSRFIETSRKHSAELVNKAIEVWKEQNPQCANLTVTCKGSTSCYAVFDMSEFSGGIFDLRECESSFNSIIYYAAFNGTNLILPQEDADNSEPEVVSIPESEPELVEVATELTPQSQPSQLDSTEKSAAILEPAVDSLEIESFIAKLLPPEIEITKDAGNNLVINTSTMRIKVRLDRIQPKAEIAFEDMLSGLCNCVWVDDVYSYLQYILPIYAASQPIQQPQPISADLSKADALQADRQQVYAQYLASQQEADALEHKLAVKKTEAQVYFAMMKEIDEQIEAKKREAEVIQTVQVQPEFNPKTLEGKQVTLVLVNTMGCPVCRHITVIAADIVSAKRYQGDMTSKMCLQLQYVEKGKRKLRGNRYTEADLAVALGWQDIKVPWDFTSFDTELFNTMVSQAKDVVYTQQEGQTSTVTMIDRLCID